MLPTKLERRLVAWDTPAHGARQRLSITNAIGRHLPVPALLSLSNIQS